jgi:antitoxin VapB
VRATSRRTVAFIVGARCRPRARTVRDGSATDGYPTRREVGFENEEIQASGRGFGRARSASPATNAGEPAVTNRHRGPPESALVLYFGVSATRAKLFQDGGSQAVRLPRDYRFPEGQREISIRREGQRVILEPLDKVDEWPEAFRACLGAWTEDIERPNRKLSRRSSLRPWRCDHPPWSSRSSWPSCTRRARRDSAAP